MASVLCFRQSQQPAVAVAGRAMMGQFRAIKMAELAAQAAVAAEKMPVLARAELERHCKETVAAAVALAGLLLLVAVAAEQEPVALTQALELAVTAVQALRPRLQDRL